MKKRNKENLPEINSGLSEFANHIYRYRHKYWSAYFWSIRKKMNSVLPDSEQKKGLFDCFDKINACYYHLKRLKEEEEKIIYNDKIDQIKTSILPGTICIPLEHIIYEYEAFLFQQEACLQVFSRTISNQFGANNVKFRKLKNILNDALKSKKRNKAKQLLQIMKRSEFEKYFDEIKVYGRGIESPRDFAAHHGLLKVGTINIYIPLSEKEGLPALKTKRIDHLYSDMKNPIKEEDLYEFCKRSFYSLCGYIGLSTGKLLGFRPKFGEKTDMNGQKD